MLDIMTREPEAGSGADTGNKPGAAEILHGEEMPSAEAKARSERRTSEIEARRSAVTPAIVPPVTPSVPIERTIRPHRRRVLPLFVTLITLAIAIAIGRGMWDAYMGTPWTRDGTVRAYVVTMAPEVAGHIVELLVHDNQFVHKGDLLMVIDPTNYKIAVSLAEAAVQQAQADMWNADRESQRRQALSVLAATTEEKETFASKAIGTQAQYQQAQANLAQARVNLERTQIRSSVDGWVTNLVAQQGDYATVGQNLISLTDANSFWVDGYFEEISLGPIHVGDPAEVKLMGYPQIVGGHVQSVARAINVANAQPNGQGVATVNPIFTWVRLAQRIPVRIQIDKVPDGVVLAAGMTATVQIDSPQTSPD
jgi:RND family efflux transporter MFP subunit